VKLRIGTRGSDLALWQAKFVGRGLESGGHEVELVVLVTRGDRIDDVPLQDVEGKAFFTKEIEDALLAGEVDLAVHSHKDLPVEGPADLIIAAVPARASAGERLLVAEDAHDPRAPFLPVRPGARVGTSSPRRREQVAALRPDLELLHLRGNVPTRVQRLRDGRYDAIVLARAGLDRLALDTSGLFAFDPRSDLFVPAPGQGALAVQARARDERTISAVRAALQDDESERLVRAERRLLSLAGGGCNLALGVTIEPARSGWRACVFRGPDATDPGREPRWSVAASDDPELAALEALGALDAGVACGGPLEGLRVVLTGTSASAEDGSGLGHRLAALGADVRYERVLEVEDLDASRLRSAARDLRAGDVVCVTSRRAARALAGVELPAGVRVAAVGPTTAKALGDHGLRADVVGRAGALSLARELLLSAGARVLHPCGVDALSELQDELESRDVAVRRVEVYRTRALPGVELDPTADARVYLSPSSVLAALAWERAHGEASTQRVALGARTGAVLAVLGLPAFLPSADDLGVTDEVVRHLHELLLRREASA